MVTDPLTLLLLSRLANVQLSLATSMRGVTQDSVSYPAQSLEVISKTLDMLEDVLDAVARITHTTDDGNRGGRLH